MSHEPIAHLYRDDEDTDPTTPPSAAEPAVITWMRGRVADADCNDPQCQVEMETVLAYDTLAQRVRDQQREITAWASTVADVEAALAGCPDADTLGARVQIVVQELAASIDKVRSTERALDAYWRETQRLEGQLTAATQRLTVMENALRAPDEILLEKVAQAYIDARIKRSGVPWEPVNNNGLSAMREALLELASELALAAATPNHGPDAGKMDAVETVAHVLLTDYQCRRPGHGEPGNFYPLARMILAALRTRTPGGARDAR